MIDVKEYCPICGNTGFIPPDNIPCSCRSNIKDIYEDVTCLEIPETYRAIKFNADMVSAEMGQAYRSFLASLYEQISSTRWKCKNLLLCAPPQSAKSVLAYTCMQTLFRKSVDVFPLYDMLEIKKIMLDLEYNRSKTLDGLSTSLVLTVPYLFAYIPTYLNYDVFDMCNMLVSRRSRRGNSTILLYSGYWGAIEAADTKKSLVYMKGDGTLSTVEVSTWSRKISDN